MTAGLAFAHTNLRWNPFGTVPEDVWPALLVADISDVVARLRRPDYAFQVIGDSGRGKSTHLMAIAGSVSESRFVYADGPVARIPNSTVLVVDEVQRLSPRARRALFARGSSLALGTHEDLSSELAAAGYEVETRRLGGLDIARLAIIVERRIEWARRGPGPVPQVAAEALGALVDRFGDDLRSIEEHLYDVFQDLQGADAVTRRWM